MALTEVIEGMGGTEYPCLVVVVFVGFVAVSTGEDDVTGVVPLVEGVDESDVVPLPNGDDDE